MNENFDVNKKQNLIIENRTKLTVSAVKEILNFDEQTVVADTSLGELTIKGDNLKVTGFMSETGDLYIEGKICAVGYTTQNKQSGFIGRLFK